jgi:fatty acid desaturase
MDETFVRSSLIGPTVLRSLSQKSDWAGWAQLASHAAAIGATGCGLWLSLGTWWSVPLFMMHGILLNFLYAGQHEMSHWTVFKTRRLNEIVGRVIGFVVLYPRDFDQIQHFAHHRFTQEWDRDGELGRPRFTLATYLLNLLGPAYWFYRVRRLLRYSWGYVREPYVAGSRHADVIREARLHLAGYGAIAVLSVALQSWAAIIYWLAPLLTMKFVHQFQNMIEHIGMPHTDNIFENTRSTRTNPFMRWLCWNMQYHTAHHAFPGVPFHRLQELDQALFSDRGVEPPRMGYWEFQAGVIRALSQVGSEAEFADHEAWVESARPTTKRGVATG